MHVLRFWNALDQTAKDALTNQVESIGWAELPRLIEQYVRNKPAFELPPDVQPAPYYPVDHAAAFRPWNRAAAKAKGEELLREGKVAAFVVAGGQGSRLGYEGPKGCYPAGAVTGKPLFAMFADAILGAYDRYGVHVPWYIMTSPLNHDATLEFFAAHHFFGLPRGSVNFFMQGVMPSLDIRTGKVLMASQREIATNPDGHGGSLRALQASGALDDMQQRGVTTISYFQVDNPIVNLLDPVFIGLHAGGAGATAPSSAQMSSKMIPKAYAEEKLGVFCAHGAGPKKGRVEIVEYSDLPMDLQREKLPPPNDGRLRFLSGSIAVHVLGRKFVEKLNTDAAFELPWHRAEKKIPCIDPETGEAVRPAANNGVKLERFVFDALPLCEQSVVLETDRIEEFAPIKNAEGQDSPQSSREIQTERAARWLEFCGVAVPRDAQGKPDCVLEISARTASTREELKAGGKLPRAIERGQRLAM